MSKLAERLYLPSFHVAKVCFCLTTCLTMEMHENSEMQPTLMSYGYCLFCLTAGFKFEMHKPIKLLPTFTLDG